MSTVICVKLELEGGVGYLVDRVGNNLWREEIAGSEPGDVYRVEIIEMDEDKLKEMPEFDGF